MNKKNTTFNKRLLLFTFLLYFSLFAQSQTKRDSLIQELKTTAEKEQPDLLNKLSVSYFFSDSFNLSIDYAKKALQLSRKYDNSEQEVVALIRLGYGHFSKDKLQIALNLFMEALAISQENNLRTQIPSSYHGIGRVYTKWGKYDKALQMFNTGLEYVDKNDTRTYAVFNNAMAIVYQNIGNTEKSIEHFKIFLEKSEQIGDKLSVIYALNNIGSIYLDQERIDEAEKYLKRALNENRELGNVQGLSAAYGNLANAKFKKKKYNEAIDLLNKSQEISLKNGMLIFSYENYRLLSEVYNEIKDYELAYKNYVKYSELKDSLFNEEKHNQITEMQTRFESQQNEKKIEILEQKSHNQRILIYSSLAAITLTIIILILLYSRYKLKIKLHKQEKQSLDIEIDQKSRELVSALMSSIQKNQIIDEVNTTISKLEKDSPDEQLKGYRDIQKRINSSLGVENEWETLKLHFEQVHPNFFKNLSQKYPDLTQYDLKHCAYIKINLSTKDIARLLNISDRSVQTARYRIKKKMNLSQDVNLMNYLQGF